MKIKKLFNSISLLLILISLLFFCGCTDTKEKSSPNESNHELLGTWYMIQENMNNEFKIVYTFHSNSSFFSGVQNTTTNEFILSIWGSYTLSDSNITMVVPEENSTSTLRYEFSDNGDTLLLYYKDNVNFDILKREL